jgi:hypothetical protein
MDAQRKPQMDWNQQRRPTRARDPVSHDLPPASDHPPASLASDGRIVHQIGEVRTG